ncbi:hypothetical protein [Aliiglaciecola litoralis]
MLTLIIIVSILIFLSFVTEKLSTPPIEKEMKPNFFGYFTAWIGFGMCILPIYQLLIGDTDADTWIGFAILTPGGLWGFLHFLTLKYRYDNNGIERTSLVSIVNAGAWKHFQSAYYSPKSYAHILEFSYGNLRVYNVVKNKKHFLDFLKDKGFEIG